MSKTQLFCFSYAGGNASFFDVIEKDMPDFAFVKLEYAGHGTRHREAFYHDFEALSTDLFLHFKDMYQGGAYALFGYSMGTITLVELLKKIICEPKIQNPCQVFLAAHEPHSKAELAEFSDEQLDEWVKEKTIQFGGVPDKLIGNQSFWRMYLPLYRADYSLIGKYKFEELNLVSDVPATIFYSQTDTPRCEMELWKKFFVGECDYYVFEGNHFFIQEHHQEMAQIMCAKLQS